MKKSSYAHTFCRGLGAGLALMLLSAAIAASPPAIPAYLLPREDGSAITYYLLPANREAASDTLLVVAQGSVCESAIHEIGMYQECRDILLPSADMLIVEKYGLDDSLPFDFAAAERDDCPEAYLEKDTPEQRVADSIAVIEQLRRANSYRRVVLLGGSEGGLIVILLAEKAPAIDAAIACNAGGRFFLNDVLHSIARQELPENIGPAREGFRYFAEEILSGTYLGGAVSDHGPDWWRSALSIDLEEALKNVAIPLLVIQSGEDEAVDPAQVEDMIVSLRAQGKSNIAYLPYQGLDHGFNSRDGANALPLVMEDAGKWLAAILYPVAGQ